MSFARLRRFRQSRRSPLRTSWAFLGHLSPLDSLGVAEPAESKESPAGSAKPKEAREARDSPESRGWKSKTSPGSSFWTTHIALMAPTELHCGFCVVILHWKSFSVG